MVELTIDFGENMASKEVYIAKKSASSLYTTESFEFKWYPGFAVVQKQKSVKSLHDEVISKYPNGKILEISTKSNIDVGVKLSAFNLMIRHKNTTQEFSVESAFQSSKVFENGGPYKDILFKSSKDAKKDERLKSSGKLTKFKFFNTEWELVPQTLFYDWLYINALSKHPNLVEEILKYDMFTDIEFNQLKSINCQAKSAALYVSLYKNGMLEDALKSIDQYKSIFFKKNNESIIEHKDKEIIVEQISFLNYD